jgi:hypothetical protein
MVEIKLRLKHRATPALRISAAPSQQGRSPKVCSLRTFHARIPFAFSYRRLSFLIPTDLFTQIFIHTPRFSLLAAVRAYALLHHTAQDGTRSRGLAPNNLYVSVLKKNI